MKEFPVNTITYPDGKWNTSVVEESHNAAIEKENLIANELGRAGTRRNTFEVSRGRAPREFTRGIEDQEQYFLIWDRSRGVVSNARRVPRVRVSTYTIEGLIAGSDRIPPEGLKVIDRAADMVKNPTASARVEGLISVFDSPLGDTDLAESWAELVNDWRIYKLGSIAPMATQVWE